MAPLVASTLTFKALHPTFGAECHGVDFSQPVPEQAIAHIRAAMARYGVLVFRRTKLDDAGHVAFARQFGELDVSAVYIKPGHEYRLAPHTELTDVANIDEDGHVASKNSLRTQIGLGNNLFHVDCSYNPRRAGYSILRAHQLPPKGTGGATAFADTRKACEDLDDETKEKIKDYVLCHSLLHSRRLGAPECELFNLASLEDFPMSRHRLMQLHEPSERMNLYIAAHAHHIDGLTDEESQPVIQDLLRFASQDKYTFAVDWENDGDVIIWDNTCVMHRACGGTFEGEYVRDMRRATVYDSSSCAWGLNQ
ncbi:Alpha-ketoglutarate-dependent 2,4-dichlorophenoxyacetate dioxygenase [Tolypocladium capitatum]|uniref:Alpha-ketoglutarate-dependent 2,4-dichlorophenoxyacetate dioxygenase n=1 Tax=Tolypocladium capitatum TaxID=45235 RepID=A0A2K3QDB9_9HYPO|nr:Alpha-ketoglutarate-dependent 2,4-dichlorophenoxyacetate dioxygenase [Tolypocladium capitatum]